MELTTVKSWDELPEGDIQFGAQWEYQGKVWFETLRRNEGKFELYIPGDKDDWEEVDTEDYRDLSPEFRYIAEAK